jgi:broad specificity polyphosphatase/5'/3'-nucleotidase SurE
MTSYHTSARITQGITITLDHISATMTHAMWHEEHLLNVNVPQTAHFSNLVKCTSARKNQKNVENP